METLALAGVALPASVIVASGIPEEEFQKAVAQCAAAGLITADFAIETHPLFRDFFWHHLHRRDYHELAMKLADAVKARLDTSDKTSLEFASLLLVAFRSYGLAGDLAKARTLRRDLSGELEATAITLYNRRNYSLADEYIQHLLDETPENWRMRLYRARIRIRAEEWDQADKVLQQMLTERPDDVGVLHAMGWSQLKQHHLTQALEIFTRVIGRREHVVSLRDAAECLHRLERTDEALKLLQRAKKQESENAFVLDLESRILEDLGQLEPAYESALLASARDPMNSHMHNRLGIIRVKQNRPDLAIPHFQKAIELDQDLFSPANSLASAQLDLGDVASSIGLLPGLQAKARTPSDSALLRHTEARIAFAKKEFDRSREILKREIAQNQNVVPNLGLLVRVELASFDQNSREFPTIAAASLKAAESAIERIVALDRSNEFIDSLRSQVEERQNAITRGRLRNKSGSVHAGVPSIPESGVPPTPLAKPVLPSGNPSPPDTKVPIESRRKTALRPPLSPPPKTPSDR
jgi:tetratricopeptide (TPR) repeat protein